MHPAYSGDLNALTKLVNTVAAPLAGAPGMPVRAEQRPDLPEISQAFRIVDSSPVLTISHFIVHHDTIDPPELARSLQSRIAIALVTPPGEPPHTLTPAQHAVADYLLGNRPALDKAWLVQHLSAIRDGSLKDIP
jgi:hypothetical protein